MRMKIFKFIILTDGKEEGNYRLIVPNFGI